MMLVDHSSVSSCRVNISGQIVGNMGRHLKVNCQECGKPMRSDHTQRHKQTCQVLRKKKNEGDAVGVNDSQTVTASETRPKKRKADCLQESKDISTFEEVELSGVKSLSEETLLRMMEMMKITYENRARILKLEKRFYKKSVSREPLQKGVISELLQ